VIDLQELQVIIDERISLNGIREYNNIGCNIILSIMCIVLSDACAPTIPTQAPIFNTCLFRLPVLHSNYWWRIFNLAALTGEPV
jgi:hypothetical protein